MGQARRGVRLARRPLAILLAGQRNALDRDGAIERFVVGTPNGAESARAEALEQAIAREQQLAASPRTLVGDANAALATSRSSAVSTAFAFATAKSFPCPVFARSWHERELAIRFPADGGVILVSFTIPARSDLLSFFDDEGEEPPTTVRAAPTQQQSRPQPRRPQRAGRVAGSIDHHTMMVRRRIAAGVGVVLLIVIVLLVNGCLKRGKQQALESYNQSVNQIGQASETEVAKPLFSTLTGASGKSALEVETAGRSSAPSAAGTRRTRERAERAERNDLGAKESSCWRSTCAPKGSRRSPLSTSEALGGHAQTASTKIAGAMEIFLASDVVYSQRVVPLIQQALVAGGVGGQTTSSSRFLPNLGWLTPSTVQSNITGQAASSSTVVTPGTHGSALKGVSVGTTTLEVAPAENHVNAGTNPTFTAMVENSGSNPQTNVKVEVSISSEGKTLKASHVIEKTEPGQTYNANVTVNGVTLGAGAQVTVYVQPVPGETDVENNKGIYQVVFGK